MADLDDIKDGKNFGIGTPQANSAFFLKGSGALEMCYQAIDQGASGVDMERNIFQSTSPVAMLKAVKAVVHDNASVAHAYELFLSEKG